MSNLNNLRPSILWRNMIQTSLLFCGLTMQIAKRARFSFILLFGWNWILWPVFLIFQHIHRKKYEYRGNCSHLKRQNTLFESFMLPRMVALSKNCRLRKEKLQKRCYELLRKCKQLWNFSENEQLLFFPRKKQKCAMFFHYLCLKQKNCINWKSEKNV